MPEVPINLLSEEEQRKRTEKIALTMKIAREAVEKLKIPQWPGSDNYVDTNQEYDVYYQEYDTDISLSIGFNPLTTRAILHTSVSNFTWNLIGEIEELLAQPEALKRLQVEESDRESVVYDKALKLTAEYVLHLPLVFSHAFHQTVRETIINHIKKMVDYDLRDRRPDVAKTKKESLAPDNSLKNIIKMMPDGYYGLCQHVETKNEEYSAYRKGAFSDRKVWVNAEVFANLPETYEKLRLEYRNCKNEFTPEKKAFYRIKRGASDDDWNSHWEDFWCEKYPSLFLSDEVEHNTPSQLAYQHLAILYDHTSTYMEKMVLNAKRQARQKSLLSMQNTDN